MSKVPIYTQAAQERYRKHTKIVQMTVNPRTEPELYAKIADMKDRSKYIKTAIYAQMGIEPEGATKEVDYYEGYE